MASITPNVNPTTKSTTLVMFDNTHANNAQALFNQTITRVRTPLLGHSAGYREFTTVANVTYWITG